MKVLWFSNTSCAAFCNDKLKGTGGWMVSLDRAIQEYVELHVVFHYPYKKEPFKVGKTTYYPVYAGNIIWNSIKNRFHKTVIDRQFLSEYKQIINRVNPDVIHIHGTENSYHRILEFSNIPPVVISIQGNLTVYAHKYLSGFHQDYLNEKIGVLTWKSILLGRNTYKESYISLKRRALIEVEDMLKARYIIGRTDWDKRITRILAPKSKYFIGNEILRDSFYSTIWENNSINRKLVVHTTNGNNYYKGFETICHTLKLLQNVGLNVEWRVAGVSVQSDINRITKKLLKADYPKTGLVLMGSLNEDDLVESLKTSHIYVMSSHIENSPNNLCEAMILGMPCVATFAGGTSSMLADKKEGLLVQDGDPWVMAGAILELLNNWNVAQQYGKAARERALARHNKTEIIQGLLNTYKEIVKDTICK